MDTTKVFDITLKQLGLGIFLLILVFVLTLSSRNIRISQSKAIISTNDADIYISEDIKLSQLIEILESANIEFDKEELKWVSPLLGWRTFKRGHYNFDGEYSYNDFLSKLAFGSQDPITVTILPGIDLERFARNLSSDMSFDSVAIMNVFNDSSFAAKFSLSKEQMFGRMLPDTYKIYWTSDAESTIKKILDEFDSRVSITYKDRAKELGYSINEITAMASIVEWEANIEDEKPIVAGLYWNRLKKRMYLQADPTISFAVGERRRLLLEDYKVDHPFNTYIRYGLPPGPVTNPSLQTIKATLYPEDHDFLYMVANPEGGHLFNETYEEHLVDAEKWRSWIRKQYRIKRQREQQTSSE
jgi:UPF0755 protein